MHRMRGGQVNEDQIKKVLGEKFRTFVNTDYSAFLCKNYDAGSKPSGCNENDFHPEYLQFVVAATNAFREIELPSEFKPKIAEILAGDLDAAISGLVDEALPLPKEALDFSKSGLLWNNRELKYLNDGFQLLAPSSTDNHGPLVNLIKYLYLFISLLDLNQATGTNVVNFLQENDKKLFAKFVQQLVDALRTPQIGSKSGVSNLDEYVVRDGVLTGLKTVSDRIIDELKSKTGRIFAQSNATAAIDGFSGKTGQDLQTLLSALSSNNAGNIDTELAKIGAIIKDRLITLGLQNPNFALSANGFNKIYEANAVPSTAVSGTSTGQQQTLTGPPQAQLSVNSAEFLYGPEINGKRYLVSEQQGNNPAILNTTQVDNVKNAVAAIMTETSPDARFASIGYLNYLINGNIDFKESMKNAVVRGNELMARWGSLPDGNRIKQFIKDRLKDSFVQNFTIAVSKYIVEQKTGKVEYKLTSKNNLLPLKNFYKEDILKNLDFYNDYFVLLMGKRGNEVPVPLDAAAGATDKDLENFRLNVKKLRGYVMLKEVQVGGANQDDIVFLNKIVNYDPRIMNNVYVDMNTFIKASDLAKAGEDAIRNIAREIYNLLSGQNQISPYGVTINVANVTANVAQTGRFTFDAKQLIISLLSRPIEDTVKRMVGPEVTDAESKIREQTWMHSSEWARANGLFKWVGNQTDEPNPIVDNCAFIETSNDDCFKFLTECAFSSEKFPDFCKNIVYDVETFKINIPPSQIKEKVVKMNPRTAYDILKKFNFGEYTGHDDKPVKDFTRYKVQSVGSWLQDLKNEDVSKHFGKGSANIVQLIMKKKALLDYLQILVDWVNANPQALNPEEGHQPTKFMGQYPCADQSYNLYDYVNPYKPARIRLTQICDGLDRLKSGIISDLAGYSGARIISNIASLPSGIAMPLNRSAYTYPIPFPGHGLMTGGTHDLQSELEKITQPHGYQIIRAFYENLLKTMQCMDKDGNAGKIKLCEETMQGIEKKLSTLQATEGELIKSLDRLVKRQELYRRSHGQIDSMKIPEDDLEGILQKHSNLMNLSAAYNKRAMNLIDVFHTIANALIGKLDDKSKKEVGKDLYRPMTMNYR